MTQLNRDKVRKAISDIRRSLDRLRKFQEIPLEEFLENEDYQDIARSRLLTAMEASINICFHITAKNLKVVPESYSHCFEFLGKEGLIPNSLARNLGNMCKFRNRLIHMYWDIDYKIVYEIIQENLSDIETFIRAIERILF